MHRSRKVRGISKITGIPCLVFLLTREEGCEILIKRSDKSDPGFGDQVSQLQIVHLREEMVPVYIIHVCKENT